MVLEAAMWIWAHLRPRPDLVPGRRVVEQLSGPLCTFVDDSRAQALQPACAPHGDALPPCGAHAAPCERPHGTKMRGVRSPGKIASKKHGRGVLTPEVRPPPRPVLGVRALSRHRTRRARPHTMSPPNAPAPFTTRPVPSPSTSPQAASAPYACAGPCAGVGCPWARSLTPYHFINTPPVTPSPG